MRLLLKNTKGNCNKEGKQEEDNKQANLEINRIAILLSD